VIGDKRVRNVAEGTLDCLLIRQKRFCCWASAKRTLFFRRPRSKMAGLDPAQIHNPVGPAEQIAQPEL